MVSLVSCEKCGCSPCDCNQRDGRKVHYNKGESFQMLTKDELRLDNIAALILRRKQPLPSELHNASAEQVQSFLGKRQHQFVG